MFFASSIWLLGLFAWALVAVWMMWGRWPRAIVPYLPLWMIEDPGDQPIRAVEPPPLAIAAMLGAGLFAILAASDPMLIGPAGSGQSVTLIVDRGLTMSARPGEGPYRFVQATASAESSIDEVCPGAKVNLVLIPGDTHPSADGSVTSLQSAAPSASVDPDALIEAVHRALANTPGLVVLVSDLDIPVEDPRFVEIPPEESLNGAGIDSLTVVGDPHPQAMIRITNESDSTSANLTLKSDASEIDTPIALPPHGATKNYFVDLPDSGSVIEATLHADGDTLLNQQAWAVRRSAWPRIVPGEGVGPELRKMIDVYSKLRPAVSDATVVNICTASQDLDQDSVGALWVQPQPDDISLPSAPSVQVSTEPFSTDGVNWQQVLSGATAAQAGPGADWQPMITVGNSVVVAARTTPVRQVWVGFQSLEFSDMPDFVVFWGEVFNWLGDARPIYPPSVDPPNAGDWVPMLYKDADGQFQALNAPPMPTRYAPSVDWRSNLQKLPPNLRRGTRAIANVLSLIALILAVVAAGVWQKRAPALLSPFARVRKG